MAYVNKGRLKKGIAYHFWSDVMTGIYAIALLQLSQSAARTNNTTPLTVQYHF
jgi:hypothetical protein